MALGELQCLVHMHMVATRATATTSRAVPLCMFSAADVSNQLRPIMRGLGFRTLGSGLGFGV